MPHTKGQKVSRLVGGKERTTLRHVSAMDSRGHGVPEGPAQRATIELSWATCIPIVGRFHACADTLKVKDGMGVPFIVRAVKILNLDENLEN